MAEEQYVRVTNFDSNNNDQEYWAVTNIGKFNEKKKFDRPGFKGGCDWDFTNRLFPNEPCNLDDFLKTYNISIKKTSSDATNGGGRALLKISKRKSYKKRKTLKRGGKGKSRSLKNLRSRR